MTSYVIILVYIIIFIALKAVLNYVTFKWKLKGFTRPPGNIFLGHLLLLISKNGLFQVFKQLQRRHGRLIFIRIIVRPMLYIAEPKVVKHILSSKECLEKNTTYEALRNWVGEGLAVCNVERWSKMRKLLNPAFTLSILMEFVDVFNSVARVLLRKLESADGEIVEVTKLFNLYSLDVICESTMGVKVNAQSETKNDFIESCNKISEIVIRRSFQPWKMNEFVYFFTRDKWVEKRNVKIARDFTKRIISERRRCLDRAEGNSDRRKLTFLDLLLKTHLDGRRLSDEEICDEVNMFMLAGHETVGYGLAYIFFCLAKNPQIQNLVFEEICAIYKNGKLTYDTLREMKYLERVVKESLRLYPPAGLLGRRIAKDQVVGNIFLPKNVETIVDITAVHKHPDIFPNPEEFNPDRFLKENANEYFMPFALGPRSCIGQKFAMIEMMATVANVVKEYRVFPANNHEPDLYFDIVMKPKGGLHLKFIKR